MTRNVKRHTFWHNAHNENSNQPAHPRSLIRVFVVRMKKLYILGYLSCAKWRVWSDCAKTQAGLNVRWEYMSEDTFSDVAAHVRTQQAHNIETTSIQRWFNVLSGRWINVELTLFQRINVDSTLIQRLDVESTLKIDVVSTFCAYCEGEFSDVAMFVCWSASMFVRLCACIWGDCTVLICSLSLLPMVPRECCSLWFWHFLGIFTYMFSNVLLKDVASVSNILRVTINKIIGQ